MHPVKANGGATTWELPPLILHPFNERLPPSELLENSRAALMLSGLIPNDGTDVEELRRRVVAGRYIEIRMLFFLGKDIFRWLEQSMEWAEHTAEVTELGLRAQSFARLLIGNPPEAVKQKLITWGVSDYPAIFARAMGLKGALTEPPAFGGLSEHFLRHYHRYADALFRCYLESEPHPEISSARFRFALFASGEYSRKLESEWEAE
jgi:hypothetical protein